jgi:hypothetical protein
MAIPAHKETWQLVSGKPAIVGATDSGASDARVAAAMAAVAAAHGVA